jgi:hypothetical protein
MKRMLIGMLVAWTCSVSAQVGDPEAWLELIRTDIKSEKVAIVTEAMQLNATEAEIFWPIQREYQAELSKLGDRKIKIIRDYLESVEQMTDKKADQLGKASLDIEKKRLKLKEKYYKKLAKAISPSTAVRYFQIETQLQAMVDVAVALELPVMPRSVLEKVQKN